MKRNTERADLYGKQTPEYISGCRQFEGEDLSYHARMANNAKLQKEWVKEQAREHEWEKARQTQEDKDYAEQTEAITRMRGILEDEATDKKANQMKDLAAFNKQMAKEKRDRENAWKQDQQNQNAFEIERTNMSDIMTENFNTTKSELAPHRFVPYHFKGLRPDQIDDIKATQGSQVVDAKIDKKNMKTEEYQWAVQNLANTQHFLNNEVELNEKNKAMMAAHRDQHVLDKTAKQQRWPNMYGDQDPLPDVAKNMDASAAVRQIK